MKQWFLFSCIGILGLTSITTLSSIASDLAYIQLVFLMTGLIVFWIVSQISFSTLLSYRWLAYFGLAALLVLTLLVGTLTKGTLRWISVGGLFSIQGSQLAVPIVGLVVARYLGQHATTKLSTLITVLLIIGLPATLIVVAPDLGTTILFVASISTGLFLSQVPWKYLFGLVGLAVAVAALGWIFFLKPYQKERIIGFSSNDSAVSGSQYNARQSQIAVGSGQAFGRGLGQGVQSHLRFLPERQTDFIFASFAEEWGFLGSFFLLSLYTAMISYVIHSSWSHPNQSEQLYCAIAATFLTAQTVVHIGMNMKLLPITGITLPFMSYGGSSIIATALLLAIVQSAIESSSPHQAHHIS